MSEQVPLGAPGPLTQAAIDKAKSLPDNRLDVGVGTTDFKTVDVTAGVRKTWSNGWGVGWWIGAKLGAGKPVGSTGVTVSKTLGLLGELETMNWLQLNLPHRESWAWPLGMIAAVLAYLSAHFDRLERMGLGPVWQDGIELAAGLAALLAAKQSMSWVPSKGKQEAAIALRSEQRIQRLDQEIDQAGDEDGDPAGR